MAVSATYEKDQLGDWFFICSGPGCGDLDPESGLFMGFRSYGWRTKAIAQERFAQHQEEHETGKPMPDQSELYAKHNPESVTAEWLAGKKAAKAAEKRRPM